MLARVHTYTYFMITKYYNENRQKKKWESEYSFVLKKSNKIKRTISILVKQTKGFLELDNLFLIEYFTHGCPPTVKFGTLRIVCERGKVYQKMEMREWEERQMGERKREMSIAQSSLGFM